MAGGLIFLTILGQIPSRSGFCFLECIISVEIDVFQLERWALGKGTYGNGDVCGGEN